MLAFGDLTWVPFTYTLQSRYLVLFPNVLSIPEVVVIVAIYLLGMYIFRSSNSQKDAFRTNPNDPSVASKSHCLSFFLSFHLIYSSWR